MVPLHQNRAAIAGNARILGGRAPSSGERARGIRVLGVMLYGVSRISQHPRRMRGGACGSRTGWLGRQARLVLRRDPDRRFGPELLEVGTGVLPDLIFPQPLLDVVLHRGER